MNIKKWLTITNGIRNDDSSWWHYYVYFIQLRMLQNIENRISLLCEQWTLFMERQTVALWIRGKTKKEIKPKEKNALDLAFHFDKNSYQLFRLTIERFGQLYHQVNQYFIFDCFSLMHFFARYCFGCYVGM